MFNLFGLKEVIDNSDRYVLDRLDYLRYKTCTGQNNPAPDCISEKVLELPRIIEFELEGIGYQAGRNHRKDYGAMTKDAFCFEDEVIPYTITNGTIEPPKELLDLGLTVKNWNIFLRESCLREFYWEDCRFYGEEAFTEKTMIKQMRPYIYTKDGQILPIKLDAIIKLKINGIDAHSYNLTLTERERICQLIEQGNVTGEIKSDGKEDIRLVREHMKWFHGFQAYCGEEEAAAHVNTLSLVAYKPRTRDFVIHNSKIRDKEELQKNMEEIRKELERVGVV